jgi:hypothetical protein
MAETKVMYPPHRGVALGLGLDAAGSVPLRHAAPGRWTPPPWDGMVDKKSTAT